MAPPDAPNPPAEENGFETFFRKYTNSETPIGRYQQQVQWYDDRAKSNQSWFRWLTLALILLSALTPCILVGHFFADEKACGDPCSVWKCLRLALFSRWTALFASVGVLGITSALKAYNFQEKWLHYRRTCEELNREDPLFNACAGPYKDAKTPKERKQLFVERVEGIIASENRLWLDIVKREPLKDAPRMHPEPE